MAHVCNILHGLLSSGNYPLYFMYEETIPLGLGLKILTSMAQKLIIKEKG